MTKQYDAIIIGFGKGGKILAGALAAAGKTVAMVERSGKMYGGTCINVGCIPSKSLVTSARYSAHQGGSFEEKAARYTQAIQEKERLTGMLRKKNFEKLDSNPNITVFTGEASFSGPHTIAINMGNRNETLEGAQIFINTGARPFFPPIPGLSESRYIYCSETLLDLDTLPRRLAVIGGGYIGMEFASMYADFGSEVTVIQDGGTFLPREDREIAEAVQKRLEAMGVRLLLSAKTEQAEDREGYIRLHISTPAGTEYAEAEAVLVATGRRPNVNELSLESAGVELTSRGAVAVDEHLRSSVPHIWAMGDVTGGLQFTYISLDDYRIVRSQILEDGKRTTQNRGAVPYSVFLDPPFSRVGLSEQDALEQGYTVKIARLPAAAIPKAQVLGETAGFLKAVIDAGTDRILGAHLFCTESHEMINLIKLAMDADISYMVLRDNIYTHPTMTEAFNDLFAAVQ